MPDTHVIDPSKPTVTTPKGQTLETIVDASIPDGHQRRGPGSIADNNPTIDPKPSAPASSADALDELFRKKGGDPTDPASNAPYEPPKKSATPSDEESEVVEPTKPAKTEAKPAKTEAEPAKPATAEPAKTAEKTAEPAKTGADPAKTESEAVKRLNESLESVQLGPNAKPKTGEAFGRVKELAREAVSALEKQLDEAKKALEEAKKASESAPPPEALAELEELRKWRNAVEVDKDPQWAEYDTKVNGNTDKIYARLKAEGMSDEQLEKIKQLGAANVKWDPLFEHMTLGGRRFIERMLLENENLAIEKEEKLAEAKKNADKFVQEREAKLKEASTSTIEARKKQIDVEIAKADFLQIPELPKDANEEQKKQHEARVKRVGEIKNLASIALTDDSPETWGALVYGTMLAHYYSDQLHGMDARLKAVEAEKTALQEKLDKIKASSRGADARKPDPSLSTEPKKVEKTSPFQFKSGRDALDALMAAKVAQQGG